MAVALGHDGNRAIGADRAMLVAALVLVEVCRVAVPMVHKLVRVRRRVLRRLAVCVPPFLPVRPPKQSGGGANGHGAGTIMNGKGVWASPRGEATSGCAPAPALVMSGILDAMLVVKRRHPFAVPPDKSAQGSMTGEGCLRAPTSSRCRHCKGT